MADAINTITRKEYSNGVKVITLNMVCATAAAAFTNVLLEERGKRLNQITITPGTTGPTDNSDLSITDSISGVNLVATNGANAVDNATTNTIYPDNSLNVIVGQLTLAIANNAVNHAEVTITLTFLRNFV